MQKNAHLAYIPQDANGISGELVSEECNDERTKAASEVTQKK